jgi:hypothetical protein
MLEELMAILGWIIFGAIGLLLLLVASGLWLWTRYFISQSLPAIGEVVALAEDHDEGSVTYAPKVRFTAIDGTSVEFTDKLFSRPPQYRTGESVKVLYHRENFRRARIATNFRLNFTAGLLAAIGSVFLGVALVGLFFHLSF